MNPAPPHPSETPPQRWHAYALTSLMVGAVTAVGIALLQTLALGNVALLYLLPVMVAASLFGLKPGLFAGIASSLAYNFFFLPPLHTLTVESPENILSLAVLLGVAIVTSHFASRARAQADVAALSARRNAAIAGFSRQLIGARIGAELRQAICTEIARLFELRTVLLLPSPDGPAVVAAEPPAPSLATIEYAAARWCLDHGAAAGRGSETLTASDWLFRPLRIADRTIATLGVARDDGGDPVRADQRALLESLLDQGALALERAAFEIEVREIEGLKERDRLRAALLASVGHDLRTPLTSILGAVAELRRAPNAETIETIGAETARLRRFLANLLDIARVEAGALRLAVEPIDLTDAIASALKDTEAVLHGRPVRLELPPDLPLVRLDPQLFHHVLINLLDNAGRYGLPGTPVTIAAAAHAGNLTLSIADEGEGLPPGREREAFETFLRLEGSDRVAGGTGLGLAIVKGFAEAMGLSVGAATRQAPRGACFSLHVPAPLLVPETHA